MLDLDGFTLQRLCNYSGIWSAVATRGTRGDAQDLIFEDSEKYQVPWIRYRVMHDGEVVFESIAIRESSEHPSPTRAIFHYPVH